jgi:asparagine synthase (glutamine-hydrolysing)
MFAGSTRRVRILSAPDPATQWLAVFDKLGDGLRSRLLRGPLAVLDGEASRRVVAAHAAGLQAEPLPAFLYLDGQLGLVDDMLHYFDRTSMAHSLEVRVPFLDHKLVEYCARIPADLKVRRLTRKYVLREAARGILPDRIVDKRKVGFFRNATDAWMRAQISGALSDYLLGPNPRYADLLDRRAVERLIEAQRRAGTVDVHLLLSIPMLEVWLSSYLPRAVRAAPREVPVRVPG